MKRTGLLLVLSMAVACGPMMPPPGGGPTLTGSNTGSAGSGSAAPGSGSDPAATAGPGFPGVFALAELKFYLGNDLGIRLHADGTVEDNEADPGQPEKWQPMFKITTDGRLIGAQAGGAPGQQLGVMSPDGSFKSSHGEVAPFKFVGEALVVEDKQLTIDDKGVLQGAPAQTPVHVEGATDAGSRRAALFVLALAFSQSDDKGGGAPPTAP